MAQTYYSFITLYTLLHNLSYKYNIKIHLLVISYQYKIENDQNTLTLQSSFYKTFPSKMERTPKTFQMKN